MRIILSICLFFIINAITISQSYLTKNEFLSAPSLYNPAFCGSDILPKTTLFFSRQLLGVAEAPYIIFASGEFRLGKYDFYNPRKFINDTRFKSMERVGVGAGIYSDVQGPFREVNIHLTYSYHLQLNNKINLSMGLTPKLNHFGTNVSELQPLDNNDPLIQFENRYNLNSDIGFLIFSTDYFIGISGVNLLGTSKVNDSYYLQPFKTSLIGGFKFKNQTEEIVLEPLVNISYIPSINQIPIDYHAKIYVKNYGWFGISYGNTTKQTGILIAIKIKDPYYIAYRYYSSSNSQNKFYSGTHGIIIGKNFGIDNSIKPIN